MMKKLIIPLFLCLLFLLSSCNSKHTPTYEELEEKIFELEEEIVDLNDKIDSFYDIIGSCSDDLITVWCYFEDEDVTYKEAYNAFMRAHDTLYDSFPP